MNSTDQALLKDITEEYEAGPMTGERAQELFEKTEDLLYFAGYPAGTVLSRDVRELAEESLAVLEKLTKRIRKQSYRHFALSMTAFIRGDFEQYLEEIGLYLSRKKEVPDWQVFERDFINILYGIPTLSREPGKQVLSRLWRGIGRIAKQYFPDSAFEAACRFYGSNGSDEWKQKLLRDVLEKDSGWALAWIALGDLFYGQKSWEKAFDSYEKALEMIDAPSADLLFTAAWCADKVKKLDEAAGYYQKCIAADPQYPFAENNLGYILIRKKQYEEAELHLKKAMETDTGDRKYPCRNLFDVYEKQKKQKELAALICQYPEYFQTKYYRERVKKLQVKSDGRQPAAKDGGTLSGTDPKRSVQQVWEDSPDKDADLPDWEELEKLLQKKTENDYAGTITVAEEAGGIVLYPHQRDAVRNLNAWNRRGAQGAGLLVLPTGGGKTLTSTYWLMQDILDKGGKVLWIAHRHELLEQALQSFCRVCYQDMSPHKQTYRYRIVSGQHDRPVNISPQDDILIAGKSSLTHNLSYIRDSWIVPNKGKICVVVDEAHHAAAGEYRKLIRVLEEDGGDFHLLGLTATPFRTARKEQGLLKKLFPDDILYKIDLRTLIERGILAEPVFHPIKTEINMAELFHMSDADAVLERIVSESGFDLDTPGSVGEQAARLIAEHRERNRLIVDTYVNNQELYGKTLIFALNIDMAVTLNGLLRDRGVRSDYIISNVRDRITGASRAAEDNREAIRRFREGELDVLVNVNILTEGTDLPEVQSVFLTRPTKSTILMTQMIGRALRGEKAGGTARAYIVSFLDEWQEYIAWVNPEKLFIDTNADFGDNTKENRKYAARLVSIEKLEEFARLADNTLDGRIEEMTFLERVPVGFYQFSYLPDGAEESRSCTVLVYDCMEEAYLELMDWLGTKSPADLTDLDAETDRIDQVLFGERDRLLGYHRQDIFDILAYYCQTEALPQWILLEERGQYDVAALARHIIEQDYTRRAQAEYMEAEWNRADGRWTAFFGYQNQNAFDAAVDQEIRRILHPERYQMPKAQPITRQEEIRMQNLSLTEIRHKNPELYEKLRDLVFDRSMDDDGYYVSAQSGYRSRNRLDFQIDHITPMARGGLTVPDNLQLLTVGENMAKGDRTFY